MIFHRIRSALSLPWQRTLYISLFAQLMTGIGFSSIFPFLPLYVEDLGTRTNLSVELLAGLVFSSQAFTMMLASPVWGVIADRYGRKMMVVRSLFGGSVIMLLMAFARSAEELVIMRAIQGLITGTLAAVNALVASVTPRERAGYAMGLLQVGLNSGLALGPVIGGAIADLFGYNAAFFVTASLLFFAGFLVSKGIKEDLASIDAFTTGIGDSLTEWRYVLREPGVVIIYTARFMSQLARMMFVPIAPLFIQTLLARSAPINTFTGLVSGISAGTTTLSSIYLGQLGDQIGHRRILIVSLGIAALLYLPQIFVTSGLQFLVLQALAGAALGGIVPIISTLLANHTQAGEEGVVYGLDNSVNSAARAIAPMLASTVALLFSLRATFVAIALAYLFAGVLVAKSLPKAGAIKRVRASGQERGVHL